MTGKIALVEKGISRSNGTPGHGRAGKQLADRPSKDGTAQKAAQEVEGLKGYQLGDCLGKGAFGSVYRALHWGTGETVAVKQVKLENLPKSELKVIMMEIDLLKNLNHPNIVKYHGFVKSVDSLYIILEYCENGSLHSICKNFGKFPENLVALYMSQVLQGLLYLHEQGVIHRDIKGANILTTKEGLVKLADFGVATKSNVSEYSVVGTPYWMAPEVIELSGATTASDIWSLGCTVIELLDGKPPYHKLQPMPALFRIVNDDHPPLPEGASPAVRDFLMQCFQKDPNLRVSAKKLLKHPWITNAKKTDSVVSGKPTKYDEAVKSVQQWNEAIKPDPDSIRRSRPQSISPILPIKHQLTSGRAQPKPLNISNTRPSADAFRSPDVDGNDNWDADFASSINPRALQLPHLKPHDNFGGLLSAENLKAYATFDSILEDSHAGDNLSSGKEMGKFVGHDPLETVKPYTPRKAKAEPKQLVSNSSSQRIPKEKILRDGSGNKIVPVSKSRSTTKARPSSTFQEDGIEDYSDLLDSTTDDAFQRKLEALKLQESKSFTPKLFHPSDLKNSPKTQSFARKSSSLRRFPSGEEPKPDLPRTNSSLEIQKYAEDENEDPEAFLDASLPLNGSDSGSERGGLMMSNSKLSTNSFDEEDEYDDPFAQLEEDFDQMDLEANVARDRYARLCTYVESLVGSLQTPQGDEDLAELTEQLMEVLSESPELKSVIISSHGMLPILEILEVSERKDIILRLLKVINLITFENVEMLENLCFVGGIPVVSEFALKQWPTEIRHEAAAFVRQVCQTSTLALQMFVSCGGLNVLVGFLEEDMESERDLVLIGVNGVCCVFELQGPTPKNDFCRILSRSSILYPLSLVLNKLVDEKGTLAEEIVGRIVNIFLPFSQAENYVKETVADRMVLKRILKDLKRMSPQHQITMLKFIKNISMLATTHESLQNSNAIEVLTDLLGSSVDLPQFREISNNVLHILFNLCRLSRTRQEDAALNGLIPLLQRVVKTERPLKELALPILCDMAHCGYVGRKVLWQNKGLQFYISLLADKYWQVTALDAILVWLQEETAKVEQHLLANSFSKAIVDCFNNVEASPDAFENFLDPLQKLLVLSPIVTSTLAHPDIFSRTAQKLATKKAVVRANLLRIIRTICDASEDQGGAGLIRAFNLYDPIERLSNNDPAVMVRELASELIKSCETSNHKSFESTRMRPGTRRSSASTVNTPQSLLGSSSPSPTTPQLLRSAASKMMFDPSSNGNKYDPPRSSRLSSAAMLTPGNLRPASRDGSGAGAPASAKARLPRSGQAPHRLARLSQRREENVTPTRSPGPTMSTTMTSTPVAAASVTSSAAAAARTSASRLAQARKKRVASGGSGGSSDLSR